MAGAPSFGKISTFICRMAMTDASATASTATRIVTGRRMAVNTNHMRCLPEPPVPSRFELFEKRREISTGLRRRKQCAPHSQARDGVVGFGLGEQPLRFRDLGHAGESVLITSACLALACRCGLTLNRRVPCNLGGGLRERARFQFLGGQRLKRSLVVRGLRDLVLKFDALARIDREDVERR